MFPSDRAAYRPPNQQNANIKKHLEQVVRGEEDIRGAKHNF